MRMKTLLLATNNSGKLSELQSLLGGLPLRLATPRALGIDIEVNETGETYAQNAALKAAAFARHSGLACLADDSGLEVDALDGRPGLHSARFSPQPGATDGDRRRLLLALLTGKPRPWTARFCCWVALTIPLAGGGLEIHHAEGVCPGEIIPEERGEHGFGYDPIFLPAGEARTMAELPPEVKNTLSHRARAVIAIRPLLLKYLEFEPD